MNIAFFNSIKSWGGGEKWHFESSVYFSEIGYNVSFFGNPEGEISKKLKHHQKVKFIPVTLTNLSFINLYKVNKLKHVFIKNKIDLLIINHPGDLKIAAHAASLAGVKKIIYRRGSAIPIKNSFLNRYIFKNWITDILANSYATKRTILEKNPNLFPEEKIKVIYNYFDIEKFLSNKREKEVTLQSNKDEIIIGNLGRLALQKNQKFLIDLSKKMNELNINHVIYIAGIGDLEEKLKLYSKEQGTENSVKFVGFIENVKGFLDQIDVFILASLWEGFGYVLAEASLCKKPIVAFDLSSNPELVLDNKSGFLIEENNINQAIEKIKILQEENKRQEMGDVGFNHCVETFDKGNIMNELEAYFLTDMN